MTSVYEINVTTLMCCVFYSRISKTPLLSPCVCSFFLCLPFALEIRK